MVVTGRLVIITMVNDCISTEHLIEIVSAGLSNYNVDLVIVTRVLFQCVQ